MQHEILQGGVAKCAQTEELFCAVVPDQQRAVCARLTRTDDDIGKAIEVGVDEMNQVLGYEILEDSLPENAYASFLNANDGTVEGVTYTDMPAFTVQFHPEAWVGGGTLFQTDKSIGIRSDVGRLHIGGHGVGRLLGYGLLLNRGGVLILIACGNGVDVFRAPYSDEANNQCHAFHQNSCSS